MEIREKFAARIISNPEKFDLAEAKFIHPAEVITADWIRLRCQYTCKGRGFKGYCPPETPTAPQTEHLIADFKFGILIRKEVQVPFDPKKSWLTFQQQIVDLEQQCFMRGYGKAFAVAAGNCLYCHHDDTYRPCQGNKLLRPSMEAVGINLADTLNMMGWEEFLIRNETDPFQMFALMMLI
jgi:predicted metal-binding protein